MMCLAHRMGRQRRPPAITRPGGRAHLASAGAHRRHRGLRQRRGRLGPGTSGRAVAAGHAPRYVGQRRGRAGAGAGRTAHPRAGASGGLRPPGRCGSTRPTSIRAARSGAGATVGAGACSIWRPRPWSRGRCSPPSSNGSGTAPRETIRTRFSCAAKVDAVAAIDRALAEGAILDRELLQEARARASSSC